MAKFISIKSVGAGIEGGDILLSGDKCLGVVVSSATNVNYHLAGGVGSDVASITYTGGATLGVKLRENINYALTANPGGVLAKVKIPVGLTVTAIALA
jgi:hypothetical protein